jgi:hypothetical protein
MPPRIPMVRPPMHAGGGVGDPFGNSGAPGMPPPGGESVERARDDVVQRYALARGRWFERVFVFPDFAILTNASTTDNDTQQIDVKSNGDSFVRLVAMRGTVNTYGSAGAGNDFELRNTFLQLEIDGLEDFTTSGKTIQPISFANAFSDSAAPWVWLAAPPILRVGETISATVSMILAQIPDEVGWQAQFALRLVDDNVWCELYGY